MLDFSGIPKSPWSIFDDLESLNADFSKPMPEWGLQQPPESGPRKDSFPPMNVWAGKDGMVIDAELPGVELQAVQISVKNDELTVSGKVEGLEATEEVTILRHERPSGEFSRVLKLPFHVIPENITAQFKNGILRIVVPRSEDNRPRKVRIESA